MQEEHPYSKAEAKKLISDFFKSEGHLIPWIDSVLREKMRPNEVQNAVSEVCGQYHILPRYIPDFRRPDIPPNERGGGLWGT